MGLESILRRLHALLSLKPDKTELILDIVHHDGLLVTAAITTLLGRGVRAFKLEVLVLLLHELLAVAFPQETAVLVDLVGVGEEFVSRYDILSVLSVTESE